MNKIVASGAEHGLPDPGACVFVKEYEIVMQMVRKVQLVLERHGVTEVQDMRRYVTVKMNKLECSILQLWNLWWHIGSLIVALKYRGNCAFFRFDQKRPCQS